MPTRVYGWEAGTAAVSPTPDAGWEVPTTAPWARKPCHTGGRLGDTALTTTAAFTSTAAQDRGHRQWVSRPMAAGNAFTTSTLVKAYAQFLESAANDNAVPRLGIRVVDLAGTTVQATLLGIGNYSGNLTEFATALTNKRFAGGAAGTGTALTSNYTTVDGDRLVIEWGHNDDGSGVSISVSSRWGSQDAAQIDLPEDETSTSTVARPWVEFTNITVVWKTPTEEVRYVLSDGVNTAGGDGTTNTNSGANRAWATQVEAFASGWFATDWPTANKRGTVYFSGATVDAPTTGSTTPTVQTAPDCYMSLVYDSPSSLVYSASYYHNEPTKGNKSFGNSGILYLRITGFQFKSNPPDSGGYVCVNPCAFNTLEPGDIRFDRVCGTSVVNNTATGGPSGIASLATSPNVKVTITNSVLFGFRGTGSTTVGYKRQTGGTVDLAFYNCLAYDCGVGFASETNNALGKNNNAQSCTDGFSGTWAAGSSNNASNIASDAPGTSTQTGTTTFVSAGTDFHLSGSDTVCVDHGTDLSADARLPFSTDGDGRLRRGTWDIGADEIEMQQRQLVIMQAVKRAAYF